MAYDIYLADRVRIMLEQKTIHTEEKKMFGGLAFMVSGKMCVGIVKNELMARIGPDAYAAALERRGCHEMRFTGKPMKGFVFVDADGTDDDHDLESWIDLTLAFNHSLALK